MRRISALIDSWQIERPVLAGILVVIGILVGVNIPQESAAAVNEAPAIVSWQDDPVGECITFTPEEAHERWDGDREGWEQLSANVLHYEGRKIKLRIPRDTMLYDPTTFRTFLYRDRYEGTIFNMWCVPNPGTPFVKFPSDLDLNRPFHKNFGGPAEAWKLGTPEHRYVRYVGPRLIFITPRHFVVYDDDGGIYTPGRLFEGSKLTLVIQ